MSPHGISWDQYLVVLNSSACTGLPGCDVIQVGHFLDLRIAGGSVRGCGGGVDGEQLMPAAAAAAAAGSMAPRRPRHPQRPRRPRSHRPLLLRRRLQWWWLRRGRWRGQRRGCCGWRPRPASPPPSLAVAAAKAAKAAGSMEGAAASARRPRCPYDDPIRGIITVVVACCRRENGSTCIRRTACLVVPQSLSLPINRLISIKISVWKFGNQASASGAY
jgi:hypothetical protein